jgi:hypothetical protein
VTVEQVIWMINHHFDEKGINVPFPEPFIVDAETYANICQFTFTTKNIFKNEINVVNVAVGKNSGIMFKGIELILERK